MAGERRRWAGPAAAAVMALVAAGCARPDEVVHIRSLSPAPMVTELPAPSVDDGWPPDLGPLGNATITVPGWGAGITACPAGRLQLTNGYHYPGPGPVTQLWVESYVATDVDRDGTEDYAATLRCGEGPEAPGWQVVAFRRSDGALTPVARVIGSQDGLAMLSGIEAREGGRIAVYLGREYVDSGAQFTPHQWRTYAFEGGRFQQVDGPTSFPADPPAARLAIDPADLVFQAAQGGVVTAELAVTVRNTGDADIGDAKLTIVLPTAVRPAGSAWAGCTEVRRITEPIVVIECPVGPLAAQGIWVNWLQVVTEGEPWLAPTDGLSYLRADQVPPYTYEISQDPESKIRITRS